jgi:hypothetical protein
VYVRIRYVIAQLQIFRRQSGPEHSLKSAIDLKAILRNLIVRHQSVSQKSQALHGPQADKRLSAAPGRIQVKPAHVCVNWVHHSASHVGPQLLHPLRHLVRRSEKPTLPVGAASKCLVDSDPRRGCHDTCLAHAAADGLAHPPRLLDGGFGVH